MEDLIDFISGKLRHSVAWQLMAVNVVAFLAVHLLSAIGYMSGGVDLAQMVTGFLELPGTVAQALAVPWTLITYMFLQVDFMHLLVNMLLLLSYGTLMEHAGRKGMVAVMYLAGGLAGAVLFIAAPATVSGTTLIGASASALAVVMCATVLLPDLKVRLLWLWRGVSLKWLSLVIVASMIPAFVMTGFSGANMAHLGGLLAGAAGGFMLRRRASAGIAAAQHSSGRPTVEGILNKIRTSGHGSLTAEERRVFFDLSKTDKRK